MKIVDHDTFISRFEELVINFREYLGSEKCNIIEVCMEVNRLSSTTRGTKHIPLFTILQVSQIKQFPSSLQNFNCFLVDFRLGRSFPPQIVRVVHTLTFFTMERNFTQC